MSALAPTTVDRMRATLAPRMDADVTGRQRLRISEELRTVPAVVPAPTRSRSELTARVAGLVAIVVLMAFAGSGVASQAAIPGDPLYPVKRLTEPFLAVFDDDLAATRRVDELVVIIADNDRADRVDRAIIDARDAVDGLAGDHPLRGELDRIVDRTTDRLNTDVVPDDAERDRTRSKDVDSRDTEHGQDDRQSRDDADTSRGRSDGGRDANPNHHQAPPTTTVPPQGDRSDQPPGNRAGDEPPPDDGQGERDDSEESTGGDEPPTDRDR